MKLRGFTIIELAVSLAAIAILAAILTPLMATYVDQSRVAKAAADTRAIGEAISRFERDLGRYPMFTSGAGLLADSSGTIIRLEGPGTAAIDTSGGSNWGNGSIADDIADQLLSNTPGYSTNSSLAKSFKWKGPYLTPAADPWGNKYLVNITNAKSGSLFATFVLSAGPDGVIDTPFNILRTSTVAPSDDDILYQIR